MPRMIAVKTSGGYRAARVEYNQEDLLVILEKNWATTIAMHGLVARGDMLILNERGGMRVTNRRITRNAQNLGELLAICMREGVHCITIFDETKATYDAFAEWNMTCEAGHDLFLENISEAGPWHHLIDGQRVEEEFLKAA